MHQRGPSAASRSGSLRHLSPCLSRGASLPALACLTVSRHRSFSSSISAPTLTMSTLDFCTVGMASTSTDPAFRWGKMCCTCNTTTTTTTQTTPGLVGRCRLRAACHWPWLAGWVPHLSEHQLGAAVHRHLHAAPQLPQRHHRVLRRRGGGGGRAGRRCRRLLLLRRHRLRHGPPPYRSLLTAPLPPDDRQTAASRRTHHQHHASLAPSRVLLLLAFVRHPPPRSARCTTKRGGKEPLGSSEWPEGPGMLLLIWLWA